MKKHYFSILFFLPILIFAQTTFTSAITPDLSAYGEATNYPGEGEYQIFLSADNILDKPIIVVDGFDTGDTLDINGIYSLLDFEGANGTQNLADQVRAEGFDVIILNFPVYTRTADNETIDGGTDFMERNAMLLVELIDIINTAKATNSPEQNVIIGPSMGGLISRYALNYMEANTLDADTRLYISFDSPHHGANIPIGLQHQLNYLAFNDFNPVTEIQPLITDFLNSPASKQLLIDHFEPHLENGSQVNFDPNLTLPEPHPFRVQFESSINGLVTGGFPQNTRNVAIINGSGIGNPYFAIGNSGTVVTNGFPIVSTTLPVTIPGPFGDIDIDVEIDINMTPSAGTSQQISRFFAPLAPPIIPNVLSTANSGTTNFDGVDAAPGGLFDLSALTENIGTSGGIAADFLNALQIDKFSFIPSVSSLALNIIDEATTDDNINWHHTIDLASDGTANNTPFDNTFLPDDNEPHVQLTEANVAFALSEIILETLSVNTNEKFNFRIEQNPITSTLTILNDSSINNVSIEIIELTGKTVYLSNNITLINRTSFAIDLNSGLYILSVSNAENFNFKTKLIVK